MSSIYSAYRLGKLKPKMENSGGNAYRRLRLHMGYNTTAAAAAAAVAVTGWP
jgi:hypothetical protein